MVFVVGNQRGGPFENRGLGTKSRLRNPSPYAAAPGEKVEVRASPGAPAIPLLGVYQEKGKHLSTHRLTHKCSPQLQARQLR